ncbi:MAG TPA: NUDIX domain-containing protein [Terriglobales bacterium]|nr:NUDIX domain-containing protein [Terriglobales bacterium]
MIREFSAGAVVLRRMKHRWWIAAIEPQGRRSPASKPSPRDSVLALPKGAVDTGEDAEHAALREVHEETGVTAEIVAKLKDIKYYYIRSWGDHQRVFKIVTFYLAAYRSGRLGNISPEMRKEVRRALWIPLEDSPRELSYSGERDVAKQATEWMSQHPELVAQIEATSVRGKAASGEGTSQ